jgi:hypothetical protein
MSDYLPSGFIESNSVASGVNLAVSFPLTFLENHSSVAVDPYFNDKANWKYIAVYFITDGSVRKVVAHRTRSGADFARIFKVIANRSILTLRRQDILNAQDGDIVISNPVPQSGVDDNYTPFTIPFSFKFLGTDYGNNSNGGVYLGTNSYVTFGYSSSVFSGISAANPGAGILINTADNWQFNFGSGAFSTATVNGVTVMRLTYDGARLGETSAPNLVSWVLDFFPNQKINLRLSNMATGGTSGISNGSSFVGSIQTTNNTNYTLSSDNDGNNWTVNVGQYTP